MAHDICIVTEGEQRDIIRLDRTTIDVIGQAFPALAKGEVIRS